MCCIFCTSSMMELQVFVSLYWDLWNAREEKETIHADWIIIIHLLCQLNLYALRSDVWVAPSGFFPSCLHQMEGNPTVQNKLDQRALEELRPSIMGLFILFPDFSFNFLCWKKSMPALSQHLLVKWILVLKMVQCTLRKWYADKCGHWDSASKLTRHWWCLSSKCWLCSGAMWCGMVCLGTVQCAVSTTVYLLWSPDHMLITGRFPPSCAPALQQ